MNVCNNNNNNNEKLVLCHEMQMLTQQRTPLSNRETRNENKCVFNILLKLNKEIEQSCKSLGRDFHSAGAE